MPDEADRLDCLSHAAHWRRRAAATGRAELREAYEQTAESYEALSRQAHLCQRLVASIAGRTGEAPRCFCTSARAAASVMAAAAGDPK